MNKIQMVGILIVVAMLMYIGTTMFYNTGLGITDVNVDEKTDANTTQYELTYMLRSVRSFEYLDCQATLLSESGQELGTSNTILKDIKDGSFTINETINKTVNDTTQKPKQVKIKIYDEKYDSGASQAQNTFFEQTTQLN